MTKLQMLFEDLSKMAHFRKELQMKRTVHSVLNKWWTRVNKLIFLCKVEIVSYFQT